MDLCQTASREVSVTEVTGKVCQAETAGGPGSTGGSVPNVPSRRDFCTSFLKRRVIIMVERDRNDSWLGSRGEMKKERWETVKR